MITQQKIILQKFENIWMLQHIKIGRDQASIYQYLGVFFGIQYRYTDISIIISIVKFWNRSLNMNIFGTILINLSFHQKHFWYTKQIDLYSWKLCMSWNKYVKKRKVVTHYNLSNWKLIWKKTNYPAASSSIPPEFINRILEEKLMN